MEKGKVKYHPWRDLGESSLGDPNEGRGRRAERRWRNDNFIGTGLLRVLARATGGESLLEDLQRANLSSRHPGFFSMLEQRCACKRL